MAPVLVPGIEQLMHAAVKTPVKKHIREAAHHDLIEERKVR